MITDLTTSILYICPECAKASVKKISAFDINAKSKKSYSCSDISCGCDNISFSRSRDKYKIEVGCPICGDDHVFHISQKNFWKNEFFILNCPESSFGILFIGKDENRLQSEFNTQNELVAGLLSQNASENDEDVYMLFDIIEKINELSQSKKIECKCKSMDIMITIDLNSVTLQCRNCNRSIELPITEELLDELEKKQHLILE